MQLCKTLISYIIITHTIAWAFTTHGGRLSNGNQSLIQQARVISNLQLQNRDGLTGTRTTRTSLNLWKNFNFNNANNEEDSESSDKDGASKKSSGVGDRNDRSMNEEENDDNKKINLFKTLLQNERIAELNLSITNIVRSNDFLSKIASFIQAFAEKIDQNFSNIKLVLLSFSTGIALTVGVLLYAVVTTVTLEDGNPVTESTALMETILTDLNQGYVDEVDSRSLFETGMNAMLSSLDPYTEFENVKDAEAMQESISSRYGGIGLVIQEIRDEKGKGEFAIDQSIDGVDATFEDEDFMDEAGSATSKTKKDEKEKELKIRAVKAFEGFAFDFGMRTGDLLVAVDGTPIRSLKSVDEVRNKLRGEIGTVAKIDVVRDGVGPLTVEVPRQVVKIPDVKLSKLMSGNDDIGYVQLSAFTTDTGLEMRNAILDLQSQILERGGNGELKGLIIDLRGNPGGLLTSAVDVASLFVPRGSDIVSAKGRGFPGVLYRSRVEPLISSQNTKLAVLINGNTASAAEILSGAIQDLDLGVIVGSDRSYGKGLVQNVQELPYSTALKYTVAKYYTPSGRCIQSIDYKDGNGKKAVKVSEKDQNVFYTRSGREVKDSGGIEADLKVPAPSASALEVTLLRSGILKDFASEWSKKNQLSDNFSITDQLYREFQSYVNEKHKAGEINLTAIYAGPLKQLQKSLEESKYQVSKSELKSLESDIVREMIKDFDKYGKDIKEDLSNAILDRYLPDSMLLSRSLKTDVQVNAAMKLLRNSNEFNQLLARNTGVEGNTLAKIGGSGVSTSKATEDLGVRLNLKW